MLGQHDFGCGLPTMFQTLIQRLRSTRSPADSPACTMAARQPRRMPPVWTKPRHGGASEFDQGPTAVLASGTGLAVMVTTRRMAPFSLEQVRHVGLDPAGLRLLATKGVHAPVAAYGEVCPSFVRVDTPGVTTADASRLLFRHRRRPLFPFER